jgi:site-specific DNA recombinase
VLRKQPVGSIGRVPAPELEAAVVDAIRRHLQAAGADPKPIPATDRELIKRHLRRVTLSATELRIDVHLGGGGSEAAVGADAETTMGIPWAVPAVTPAKGIAYVPAHNTPMKPGRRELLLIAIAKARRWVKNVEHGHSFADIARREGKAERYVRQLAPLAFVSPRIITALIDDTAPAGLTVTTLAARLPYSWAEQEQWTSTPPDSSGTPQSGRTSRPVSAA